MAEATGAEVTVRNEGSVVPNKGAGIVPNRVRDEATRAVVFIDTQNPKYGQGSGFLTELPGDDRLLLVTCNHVIPNTDIAKNCVVSIDRLDEGNPGTPFSGKALFDFSSFWTDEQNVPKWGRLLDFTIIGVNKHVLCEANLERGPPTPLLMTDFLNMTDELKVKDMVCVVHYPKKPVGFPRCTNSQLVLRTEGPIFGHSATTQGGSSGCPIFREFKNRWIVVGLHRGELPCGETILTNIGTRMSVIYDAFKGKLYSGQAPDIEKFAYGAHALTKESTASGGGEPILSTNVYDTEMYLVLLRKYVSNHATGKGALLLAALGLEQASIDAVYGQMEKKESTAVHAGLNKWSDGYASKRPTWQVLLDAMEDAEIAEKPREELKKKLEGSGGGKPILSANVYDTEGYLVLFRKYVSNHATGKGTLLLAALGLEKASIDAVYGPVDNKEIDAVHKGLLKWSDGHASNKPTWQVLLDAMDDAEIAEKPCKELKEKLEGSSGGKPFLSAKVYDTDGYLVLLRKYVSKHATGKGELLLAALGLDRASIDAAYGSVEKTEISAVHDGLIRWSEGNARKRPTWQVLLNAMDDAEIAEKPCKELKEKLTGKK